MNLDHELRAVLSQEAEARQPSRPDVESLLRGGRGRRRRRDKARLGVAAAVAVLVVAVAAGVTQLDPGNGRTDSAPASEPSQTPAPTASPTIARSFQDEDGTPIEPGRYRMFAGLDRAGAKAITAGLTIAEPGWLSGSQPVVAYGQAGVGIYQPDIVSSGSGCSGDSRTRVAATEPSVLAQQLARLPKATVLQPPTPTVRFGHDAVHLRLRIDQHCPVGEVYRIADGAPGIRGISYGDVSREVVIDFWVVDVDGTAVVVDGWHQDIASTALEDQVTRALSSIRFLEPE